uniref:Secreted protein n=1 Tax=Plectus sambesii TaxID=2011161 RepID=A0A914UKK8_9BILA
MNCSWQTMRASVAFVVVAVVPDDRRDVISYEQVVWGGGDAGSRATRPSTDERQCGRSTTRSISGLWIYSAERFVFDLVDPSQF